MESSTRKDFYSTPLPPPKKDEKAFENQNKVYQNETSQQLVKQHSAHKVRTKHGWKVVKKGK